MFPPLYSQAPSSWSIFASSASTPEFSAIAYVRGFTRPPGSNTSCAGRFTAIDASHLSRSLRIDGSNDGHDAIAVISTDGTFITSANADSAPFVAHAAARKPHTAFWTSGTMVVRTSAPGAGVARFTRSSRRRLASYAPFVPARGLSKAHSRPPAPCGVSVCAPPCMKPTTAVAASPSGYTRFWTGSRIIPAHFPSHRCRLAKYTDAGLPSSTSVRKIYRLGDLKIVSVLAFAS